MPDPAGPPSERRPDVSSPWDLHLWQIQPIRDLLVIAAIIGLIYLGYLVSLVTVPILIALLLAYLFEPLVRRMVRTPLFSRPGAAIVIVVTVITVFLVPVSLGVGTAVVQGIHAARNVAVTSGNFLAIMRFTQECIKNGPTFGTIEGARPTDPPEAHLTFRATSAAAQKSADAAQLAYNRLPPYLQTLAKRIVRERLREAQQEPPEAAPSDQPAPEPVADQPSAEPPPTARALLASARAGDLSDLFDTVVAWIQQNAFAVSETLGKQAVGTGAEAVAILVRTFHAIGKLLLTVFLTAFFFYFFSTSWGRVLAFWEDLIPERKKGRVIELVQKMDRVIAGFVRGRLTICAIIMVWYTVAYWFIGVPAPLLIGPIVGAFAIVPFLTILAIPITIVLLALQPDLAFGWQQTWWWIIGAPIVAYFVERILDDYILTPAIQGKHTEMAIPTIVFASITGGVLAGVYGLLIAIPVAACVRILLREAFWPRFKAWAEGRERDFLPISQHDPEPPAIPPM